MVAYALYTILRISVPYQPYSGCDQAAWNLSTISRQAYVSAFFNPLGNSTAYVLTVCRNITTACSLTSLIGLQDCPEHRNG